MSRISWIILGAGLLSAPAAIAQPVQGSGFSLGGVNISGYADLSYFDDGTDNGGFGRADLDVEFMPGNTANGVALGFSLGFDGAKQFDGNVISQGTFYPALVLGFGNHKVSVGAPRSVANRGYYPETMFANNARFDLKLGLLRDSVLSYVALTADYHPYGIRYDGTFDQTKVGVSTHRIDESGITANFYALAVSHTYHSNGSLPELTFYGGVERVESAGLEKNNYTLGVEAESDKFRLGLKLGKRPWPYDARIAEVYGKYQFNTSLSATASVFHASRRGADLTVYGIGAEYTFLNNAYLSGSIADGNNNLDTQYAVSIGWRF